MKRCPTCRRTYRDESLNFCRVDGAPLAVESDSLGRLEPTRVIWPASGEGPTEVLPRGGDSGAVSGGVGTSSSLTTPLPPGRRRRSRVIDSLAVLPLENASDAPDSEYLSDGITEAVINSLSRLPRLRVVPRATVFRYKGRDLTPQEVGRQLGVRAVVSGRMHMFGDLLVVSAELIDVEQDAQVWGEQYRHAADDIFVLQERIAGEISEKLRLRLSGEDRKRLRKRPTENADAYHLYLKGRYYLNKRTTEWIKRGIEHFRRAIDIDPSYALAHAGLADAYAFLASSTGEQPPADFYPKAEAAALKALELDDTLAEAHSSLGFYHLLYEYDFEAAGRAFARSIELNPAYANAHDGQSFYFKATAQHERALAACRRAHKLDPLSLFADVSTGWAYYFARRYDDALEHARRALELDPHFIFAHWLAGVTHALRGAPDEAADSLALAVEHSGGGLTFKAHLGYVRGLAGRTDEARGLLGELEGHAEVRYVPAYYFALIHLGLGDYARAVEGLTRAYQERSGFLAFIHVEPTLDPLRTDPRFKELARRVGPQPQ